MSHKSPKKSKLLEREDEEIEMVRNSSHLNKFTEQRNSKKPKKRKEEIIHKQKEKKVAKVWTKEEDDKLLHNIEIFGTENWLAVANSMPTANIFQCKQQYYNHLDPLISHEPFTIEEDVLIIKKVNELGKNWIDISKFLPGKTPARIKHHYEHILKEMNEYDDDSDTSSSSDDDDKPGKPDYHIKQFIFNQLLETID